MIKEMSTRWIDDNDNRWDKSKYTREQAEAASKSLICCRSCMNCEKCGYCHNCKDCKDCQHCGDCDSCTNCEMCGKCYKSVHCTNCTWCRNCTRCEGCTKCDNCEDAVRCWYSRQCERVWQLPGGVRIVEPIGKYVHHAIGRRDDRPSVHWNSKETWYVTGCFSGSEAELRERVAAQYPAGHKHHKEYMAFIEMASRIVEDDRKQAGIDKELRNVKFE